MDEKNYYDWSLSRLGDDKYKYEYTYRDDDEDKEYKVTWTKEWSAWDYTAPFKVSFIVKVLSGPSAGETREHYFYSEARKDRDELLSNGVCAIMRYIKNEKL